MKNKNGFTMSEVLITLGVIGVVSAMTMPSVIKNYQKHKTVNQLKKAYTVLNQALKMSELDNDTVQNWSKIEEIGITDYTNKYWKPYLKVIKTCKSFKGCDYKDNTPWQNANKTNIAITGGSDFCIFTNDGMLIFFRKYLDGNATVFVDLNGTQLPNKLGNDLFVFTVRDKGVVPAGNFNSTTSFCNKTATGVDNGVYCSWRIIREGWKIPDDYPW